MTARRTVRVSGGWRGRVALVVALLLAAAPAAGQDRSFGVWRNPGNSVHVRIEPCGAQMCGVVVWANDKAKADAHKGGTDPLVGLRLFESFVEDSPGVWRGRVFVPDIGKTFSGTVSVVNADRLIGRGCLLRGIGCKSQEWTRVR